QLIVAFALPASRRTSRSLCRPNPTPSGVPEPPRRALPVRAVRSAPGPSFGSNMEDLPVRSSARARRPSSKRGPAARDGAPFFPPAESRSPGCDTRSKALAERKPSHLEDGGRPAKDAPTLPRSDGVLLRRSALVLPSRGTKDGLTLSS
ncbi:hypothetical protein THAOC_08196, partial [Thalassiosira oceanica]